MRSPARSTSTSPGAARHGKDGKPVFLRTSGRPPQEIQRPHRASTSPRTCSRKSYADVFEGDERLAGHRRFRRARSTRGTTKSTYVKNPPYFDGMTMNAGHGRRRRRRARARAARRLGHDRSHLARRQHHEDRPAAQIPASSTACSRPTSTVRRAPRQPRGHDARHVREHPPAATCCCPASKAA